MHEELEMDGDYDGETRNDNFKRYSHRMTATKTWLIAWRMEMH